MHNIKYLITIVSILFSFSSIKAEGYRYEKKVRGRHVIHIVTIPPNTYTPKIVKARKHNESGRESVRALAKRHKATIAINGGFFEIGSKVDGKPSFTLVINGKQHALKADLQSLVFIQSKQLSIIRKNPKHIPRNKNLSLLTGLPMLVENGKVPAILSTKTSDFYTHPHARTAIGVDAHKNIIIVVAEHYYTKDVNDLTMGEVKSLLKAKGPIFAQQYNKQTPADLTLKELNSILKAEFSNADKTQGLTILELANLMQTLGCESAINLDGGGSSTLYINGDVINRTIGDTDEHDGTCVERSVSDAILFVK